MAELFYAMMREADAALCWRYMDKDGDWVFRALNKRRVCILERGHDDGVHEVVQ